MKTMEPAHAMHHDDGQGGPKASMALREWAHEAETTKESNPIYKKLRGVSE